jgi:hypothetical protein
MEGFGQFIYQRIVDRCFSPINKARFMSLTATNAKLTNFHRSVNIVASNSIGINLDIPEWVLMVSPDPKNCLSNEETKVRYCREIKEGGGARATI